MPTNFNLKERGYFRALMKSPADVRQLCLNYLQNAERLNLAGLCAELGTSVHRLVQVTKNLDEAVADDRDLESMNYIAQAITYIEEHINEYALSGDYSAHFAKFNLSAYHNRNEKTLVEQNSSATVNIVLASSDPTTLEELREYERLEAEMSRQIEMEKAQIGLESDIRDKPGQTPVLDPELMI